MTSYLLAAIGLFFAYFVPEVRIDYAIFLAAWVYINES